MALITTLPITFQIGTLLGRGSFGRVYKGRWGSTGGALVAVKIIEAGDIVAALGEAAAVGEGGGGGGGGGGASGGGASDLPSARAARESLLSVVLAHPNVS